MSIKTRSFTVIPSVALTTLLAACASSDVDPDTIACPLTQIAVPADSIGFDNDDNQLRFAGRLQDLTSSCRMEDDDIEVDLTFVLRAESGPGFDNRPTELTYFLATVDPTRTIIDKQLYKTDLDLGPDQPISAVRERVTLRLPVPTEETGANYSIYLGFQP